MFLCIFNFKKMKKFLIKYLVFIIPILIFLIILEMLTQEHDKSSTYYQKKYIDNNKSKIDGIIFGPSHSWYGIYPKYLNYNVASLALTSSSPNVDYLLYNYTKEKVNPKFLIFDLSLGYLTTHNDIDYISHKKLSYYFSNIKKDGLKDFFLVRYPLKDEMNLLFKDKKSNIDKWGFQYKVPPGVDIFSKLNFQDSLIVNDKASEATLKRHKERSKESNTAPNISLYKKIVSECVSKEVKVVFISLPKYYVYNEKIDKTNELSTERMKFLNEIVDNKLCFFLNYEDFFENDTKLYYDIDHLNTEGAIAFTKELNRVLKDIILIV